MQYVPIQSMQASAASDLKGLPSSCLGSVLKGPPFGSQVYNEMPWENNTDIQGLPTTHLWAAQLIFSNLKTGFCLHHGQF